MSNPSLLCVPYRFKTSKLYSQIPDSGLGDFTITRATTPTAGRATRINAAGFIELVADNVPRLDYPLGGITAGCPALLVEPSAQNLALQSEDLGTGWSLVNLLAFGSGSVLNTTATLDPYGTNVADLIVANTTVGQHRADRATVSASGSYTFSIFVKAAGYGFIRLRIGGDGAVFDLSNGNTSGVAAGIVASSQNYGNGWYRCIISKAAAVANEDIRTNMQPTSSTADFAGNGTSGIYVFGAQYEAGSVATSYIPTTTAAITRGADTISKTGVSSLIGQSEGTIYAEVAYSSIAATKTIISITDGTSSNRIAIRINSTTVITARIVVAGASNDYNVTIPAIPSSGILKISLAYKANDYVFAINGTTYASTTTRPVPATNAVTLGNNGFGSDFLNDRILAAELYPTRLTNAQLQSLTQ